MISTAKPRVRVQQQNIYTAEGQIKFRLFWNRYSDRVATFSSNENPYHWENGFCTYLGFPTKAVALAWQQHLLRIGVATKAEYRKVNRLKVGKPKNCAIRWELKVRGLTYRQLLHLLTFDLTQVPPQPEQKVTAHDFETCDRDIEECLATELKLELASQPDSQVFQVGDRVEVCSSRHGREFDWEIGIVAAASRTGASVNVKGMLHYFCNDELVLIEAAAQPREAKDDLFPPLVSQEPTTPRLPAYNHSPIGRAGAASNWRAIQTSGRGLMNSGTGLKSMEEWRQIEQQQKLAATAVVDDDIDF